MWYDHTLEYHTALKINKLLLVHKLLPLNTEDKLRLRRIAGHSLWVGGSIISKGTYEAPFEKP